MLSAMIAIHHSLAVHNQMASSPWTADDIYDLAMPDVAEESPWSDDRQPWDQQTDTEEQDSVLNHLRHLTVSSLSSYQEIVEVATDGHLKSFAAVIARQRAAQQQSLFDRIESLSTGDEEEHAESLTALRSIWRCAIWNLEQENLPAFLEYAERAESFLEEAYLEAAMSIDDADLSAEMRDYAVMVYGARAIYEELSSDLSVAVSVDAGNVV